jgi:hypothetical protein
MLQRDVDSGTTLQVAAHLESAGVGEGHVPWVGGLVHLVQVQGGLQLRLTARQEHDAWHSGGHTAAQQAQGVVCHLSWAGTVGALSAWGHHGRLQQDALKQHLQYGGGGKVSMMTRALQASTQDTAAQEALAIITAQHITARCH